MTTAVLVLAAGLLASDAWAQGKITGQGIVTDENGDPLPEVEVTLEYKGHVFERYFTKTDQTGKFLHVNIYKGPYVITLKKEGYGEGQVKWQMREIGQLEEPPSFTMRRAAAQPEGEGEAELTPEEQRQKAHKAVNERMNLAVKLAQADRLAEAKEVYAEILELAPGYADAHYNLGHLLKREGDAAAAEAEFRKAIELEVEFVDPYNALAALLLDGGKMDEASEMLARAAELEPDNAQIQFNLGVMAQNTGKTAEAQAAFERTAELDPDNAEVHFYLGTIAVGANKQEEAITHLEKYLSLDPENDQNIEAAKGILAYLKK